ncbi:MAG: FAD-dependent oxidoreductase [Gammaproteobacteria bacterium]|nr:MAG: FAD-dependent oxidoreductase [Gammaproteobacteria bacterium]
MPDKSHHSHIRRIAVIGSGLSGLTSAILLRQKGHQVTVFEKSRGPGGRLASKRVPDSSADVGAQYFTARNPEFLPFLRRYAGAESFALWHGKLGFRDAGGDWSDFPDDARYVGVPRMTAISRQLSAHVDLVTETRIEQLICDNGSWCLIDTSGHRYNGFDQVLITAPPAQTQDLLKASGLDPIAESLNEPVEAVLPCWAVAARFDESPWDHFEGARVEHPVLYWIGNNSSKPGRHDDGQWWVLHAGAEWTTANVDRTPEAVADALLEAFSELTGYRGSPSNVVTHRWLYARSEGDWQPGHLWYPDDGIGIAGDWLAGGRVEGAFNSAFDLVTAIDVEH